MDYQSEYKDLYRNYENIYEENGEFNNEINDYLKKKIICSNKDTHHLVYNICLLIQRDTA